MDKQKKELLVDKSSLFVGGSEGSLLSPAGSVRVGSTVPRTVFTSNPVRLPSLLYVISKGTGVLPVPLDMVDPRGVEPLSENPLIQPSTWVVTLLFFSYGAPRNRLSFGYHFNA